MPSTSMYVHCTLDHEILSTTFPLVGNNFTILANLEILEVASHGPLDGDPGSNYQSIVTATYSPIRHGKNQSSCLVLVFFYVNWLTS